MCNSCPLEEHRCSCSACSDHDHGHEHETSGGERRELLLMGVSAVLFAVGMLADTRLEAFLPSWLVLTLCYVLPYALCGYDVLRQMLRNLMRGDEEAPEETVQAKQEGVYAFVGPYRLPAFGHGLACRFGVDSRRQ